MKTLPPNPAVGVLGATGAVGRVMLEILHSRRFPHKSIRVFASERSLGSRIPFGESELDVEVVSSYSFDDLDLVICDTPDDVAKTLIPKAVEAGAIAIDNSAAWRMDPSVPLIVPEVNGQALESHRGIIACPNCTTVAMILPLAVLHAQLELEKVIVSSYQAVSGAGRGGTQELAEQVAKLVDGVADLVDGETRGRLSEPVTFTQPIAFNVLPSVGSAKGEGFTGEEIKCVEESRKILALPGLAVAATCVRVPTVAGHGVSVHATFRTKVDVQEAAEMLGRAEGITVTDVPTALQAAGSDNCFVGRIRTDPTDPKSLMFFATCDNLRKGAALNAVQIAEALLP